MSEYLMSFTACVIDEGLYNSNRRMKEKEKKEKGGMSEMLTLPEMHNLDYLPLDDTTLMEDETGYFHVEVPYDE